MCADLPDPGIPVIRRFGLVISPSCSQAIGWQEKAEPVSRFVPMYGPSCGTAAPYRNG